MSQGFKDLSTIHLENQEQRRDKLLLALLKTPPQPRPKRERGKVKRAYAKRANAEKPAPAS